MQNAPLNPWLRFQFAKLLTMLGARSAAVAQLRIAVREQPGFQHAWRYLAFLMSTEGDRSDAIEAFETAVRLDPADAVTRFNFGFLLQHLGRREEAAAQFREVTRLAPTIDRAWFGLGLILIEQHDYAGAAEKLSEAARLQYFNPHAGYHLALAYQRMGERDKAKAEYERVKSFDPKVAEQIACDLRLF